MGPKAVVRWSQACTVDDLSRLFGASCSQRRCFSPLNCDRRWDLGIPLWTREYETINAMEAPVVSGQQKFKIQASTGKVMLTIFWDVNGPILVHFQEKGQTVTSTWYSDMLVDDLKPTIWLKCQGFLSKRVLLLHDNAHPHTAVRTMDTVCALKFEVLKHPPYSPDLLPSDFHLFGPMTEHLWARSLQMTTR
jgi:hypothetical protein